MVTPEGRKGMTPLYVKYTGDTDDADEAIARIRSEHPEHKGNVIAIPESMWRETERGDG